MICDFSPAEKCAVRNVLSREWGPHLSSDEFRVLHYLIDNTIEWGRRVFDFTWEQIAHGIPAEPGQGWAWKLPPLNMSRATFYRVVASLVAKGAIMRETVHRTCTRLVLNLVWSPREGVMSPKLAMSKRKRAELGSQAETQDDLFGEALGSQIETQTGGYGSQIETPIKQNVFQQNVSSPAQAPSSAGPSLPIPKIRRRVRPTPVEATKDQPVSPAAPVTAREALQRVAAKAEAKRAKASHRKVDASNAYLMTWKAAWQETFPQTPVYNLAGSELHALVAVLRQRFHNDVETRHAFLDFCVRNWSVILAKKFKWMRQSPPPPTPKAGFIIAAKMMPHFLDAFAERNVLFDIRLTPGEEGYLKELLASGLTRDEAMQKVGERRALSRQRAQDQEVRRVNATVISRAEEARRKLHEDHKRLMAERARLRQEEAETREYKQEHFEELDGLPPIDLPELPPFDPSKFN